MVQKIDLPTDMHPRQKSDQVLTRWNSRVGDKCECTNFLAAQIIRSIGLAITHIVFRKPKIRKHTEIANFDTASATATGSGFLSAQAWSLRPGILFLPGAILFVSAVGNILFLHFRFLCHEP